MAPILHILPWKPLIKVKNYFFRENELHFRTQREKVPLDATFNILREILIFGSFGQVCLDFKLSTVVYQHKVNEEG